MNKQNLWFITLFSVILILCIYYISIPNNLLDAMEVNLNDNTEAVVNVSESSDLVGLRVEEDEATLSEIENLQNTITDNSKTTEEKNLAYEQLKNINLKKAKEEEITNLIKKEFNFNSFVKINQDQINIVVNEKEHNKELANNIIKKVQSLYPNKKYITVKFN